MDLTISMNSVSLEPRSRSIACLVVMETPSGPGVNNFFCGATEMKNSRKWNEE